MPFKNFNHFLSGEHRRGLHALHELLWAVLRKEKNKKKTINYYLDVNEWAQTIILSVAYE